MIESIHRIADEVIEDVLAKDLRMYYHDALEMVRRSKGSGTLISKNEAKSSVERYWKECNRQGKKPDINEFEELYS